MKNKTQMREELLKRGMSFKQLKKKFKTVGERNTFYKKFGIKKYKTEFK